ncbi:MAG: MBL fold metallo-hydrolase [Acidobacteriota bacterium]
MYGNCPRAMWERWTPPDDRGRIELACRALLVEADDQRILFETGVGAFFPPKLRDRYGVQEEHHVLLQSLAELDLTDEDIDVVVLSHLHFDHAGGLLAAHEEDEPLRLLFPRARYLVGREAFDRAVNPHPRDRASFIPELPGLLEESGRLELVDSERSASTGERCRFHFSHGHTPGLLLSEVATPAGPLLFASDLIPGAPWVHLPITMGYDRYPERLIDEKREVLEDLLEREGRLFFTHDPAMVVGQLQRDDRGRFKAETTRLE